MYSGADGSFGKLYLADVTLGNYHIPCVCSARFASFYQKCGLIIHSVNIAGTMGYPAICIYGDPRYYSRFGFRCAEKYEIKTADDKFAVALLALELKQGVLNDMPGRFIESAAFEVNENEFVQYEAAFPFKEKAKTDSQLEFRILASLRY